MTSTRPAWRARPNWNGDGGFDSRLMRVNRNILIVGAILFAIVMAACTLMIVFGLDIITDPPPALPPGR